MLWRAIGYGGPLASGLLAGATLGAVWRADLSVVQFGMCLMSYGLGSLFSLWGRETLDERQMKVYGLLAAHLVLPLTLTFVEPLNICVALIGFCLTVGRSAHSLILRDCERNLAMSSTACYVMSPLAVLAGVVVVAAGGGDVNGGGTGTRRALLAVWGASMLSLSCWSIARWRSKTPWMSRDGAISLWTDLSTGGRTATERLMEEGIETPRGRMRSAVSTLFKSVADQYARARESPTFRISILGAVVSALKLACVLWTPYLLAWPPIRVGWPPLSLSWLADQQLVICTALAGLFLGRCSFAFFREKFEDILYRDEVMTLGLVVSGVGLLLMALLTPPWSFAGLLLLCLSVAHIDPMAHSNAWLFSARNWYEILEALLNILVPMSLTILAQTITLRAAYILIATIMLAATLLFHYLPLATEKALMSTLTMDIINDHDDDDITFTHQ